MRNNIITEIERQIEIRQKVEEHKEIQRTWEERWKKERRIEVQNNENNKWKERQWQRLKTIRFISSISSRLIAEKEESLKR